MFRLRSFCCCCHLRTGVGCVVAFDIYGIIDTVLHYLENVVDEFDFEFHLFKCIGTVVFGLVLMYGTWQRVAELVAVYAINKFAVIISDSLYLVYCILSHEENTESPILYVRIVYYVLQIYFYLVVVSFYFELREDNAHREREDNAR